MTTFQFQVSVPSDGIIILPPEYRGRDVDVRVVSEAKKDKAEWTQEDEERRQKLIELLKNAPVMSDEEYHEWLETRKTGVLSIAGILKDCQNENIRDERYEYLMEKYGHGKNSD